MKKTSLLLLSFISFFPNAHASLDQILKNEKLLKKIEIYEEKYEVDCIAPKERQIHWMCSNGPDCGFWLDITCINKINQYGTNRKIRKFSFLGQSGNMWTNYANVEFDFSEVRMTEFKELEGTNDVILKD